jgi:hypothetical protein
LELSPKQVKSPIGKLETGIFTVLATENRVRGGGGNSKLRPSGDVIRLINLIIKVCRQLS